MPTDTAPALKPITPRGTRSYKARSRKINVAEAYRLRYEKHLSYGEIGRMFGSPASSVASALKRFESMVGAPDELRAFAEHRDSLTAGVEAKLLESLTNSTVIEKAGLRDRAIAYSAVAKAGERRRDGGDVNVLVVGSLVAAADKALFVGTAVGGANDALQQVVADQSGRTLGVVV